MAEVFADSLGVAEFREKYLHYKDGYVNSLTCFQGFGPSPNKMTHTFDGLVPTRDNEKKLTVVIRKEAISSSGYWRQIRDTKCK